MSQIPFVLKVGQVQSYGEGQTFGWVRSAQSPDGTIYFCKGHEIGRRRSQRRR